MLSEQHFTVEKTPKRGAPERDSDPKRRHTKLLRSEREDEYRLEARSSSFIRTSFFLIVNSRVCRSAECQRRGANARVSASDSRESGLCIPFSLNSYRTDPSLSVRAGPCPVLVIIGTHYIGTDQSPHVRTSAGNHLSFSPSLAESRQVIRIHVKARAHPRAPAGLIVSEIRHRKKPGELRANYNVS